MEIVMIFRAYKTYSGHTESWFRKQSALLILKEYNFVYSLPERMIMTIRIEGTLITF
jgi:hypothetical protein